MTAHVFVTFDRSIERGEQTNEWTKKKTCATHAIPIQNEEKVEKKFPYSFDLNLSFGFFEFPNAIDMIFFLDFFLPSNLC